jgi:lipid-A-disaccharide synthase
MRYYLIAGERSGDLHGANLLRAIHQHDPEAECRAWGGEQMQAAGATLVRHYRDTAFMGLGTVLRNLFKIRAFFKECEADVLAYQPDVLILIDYAGFNMRMARFAKTHGVRTFYYISPKVWAWNQRRALSIKAYVDKLFVIFPFEVDFFKQYHYEAHYVGNPLLDAIRAFEPNEAFATQHGLDARPVVALLPGSRRQEVAGMLPVMLSVVSHFPDYQFVVAKVSNLPAALYDALLVHYPQVRVVQDAAYDLLSVAEAALVTSGTATLETALFRVPQVVCYRTGGLTYWVGRRLIKVKYLSLVNLMLNKAAVPELIQSELNTEQLRKHLTDILQGGGRDQQLKDYAHLAQIVGEPGASERAGTLMVQYLKEYKRIQ